MKKTLIISGTVFLLGAVILAVGFGGLGFDYRKLSTDTEYIERTYTAEHGVESVIADCSNCDVYINEVVDGQIKITYTESKKNFFEITKSGNILTVESKKSMVWSDYIFNISLTRRSITLNVPSGYKGDIKIKTDNGNIVYNLSTANNVTLETDNHNITAANADITGSLKMATKNGTLQAAGITVRESAVFTDKNGSINLDGITAGSISAENKNGRITLKNSSSEAGITLSTENKSIDFENVYFATQLECLDKNGSIKGSVVGKFNEFSFDTVSKNGDNNLPESVFTKGRLIRIKTDNGDIDVSFIERPATGENKVYITP